jgi:hypothetical protein
MIWRRHDRDTPPIVAGMFAVRYSSAQLLAEGAALRGLQCLYCQAPIGSGPAVTVTLTDYRDPGYPAGSLPCSAWLVHAGHSRTTVRVVRYLAEWRLATASNPEEEST